MIVYLRPHHLLCLPHFQGYGYNERHTHACLYLYHQLYTSKYIIFQREDILCAVCPKEHICNPCLVSYLDSHVLYCINATYDIQYQTRDIYTRLLKCDSRYQWCKQCEWDSLCRSYREQYGEYHIYQRLMTDEEERSEEVSHFSSLKNMRRLHWSEKEEQQEKCTQNEYIQQLRLQRWLEKKRRMK